MDSTTGTEQLLVEVQTFVAREARLADQHQYADWEALWADDADCLYWVPAGGRQDPTSRISYVYDNRARIRTRVRQLVSNQRYAMEPPPNLARVTGNVEVLDTDGNTVTARCTFILAQYRATHTTWAGATTYRLRRNPAGLQMLEKKVELIDRNGWLPTFAFIL
jgi:benzoate/toluate 1,2-dioxygenase subunit beta